MKDNPLSPEECVSLEHMAIELAHNRIENEKELKSTKVDVNSSLGSFSVVITKRGNTWRMDNYQRIV